MSFCAMFAVTESASAASRVFIGTYTGGSSEGIYSAELDAVSGELTGLRLVAKSENPSFLCVSEDGKSLYAVNEVGNFRGERSGAVSAFRVSDDGDFVLLNQQPTGGGGPCHLALDRTGKTLFVANYGGGSVASFPVLANGSLGPQASFVQHVGSSVNERRQNGPHGHHIITDPDNRFALACDLGLDKVLVYKLDSARSKIDPAEVPFARLAPGAGPRHLTFHPSGQFCHVINELDCTITTFRFDAERGWLGEVATVSTLPEGVDVENGFSTAEIETHPSGRFVYGSNRGHDSISVFSVDPERGTLTQVQNVPTGGRTPRNFGIDPSGTFLLAANQNSDTIVVFRIDPANGTLRSTDHVLNVPSPVSVVFVE